MHIIEPTLKLTPTEEQYLNNLRTVFGILSTELSQAKAVKKITKLYPDVKSRSTIYRWINHTKDLFGNIIKSNKEFDRNVIRERLIAVHKKCMKAGEYKEARLALVNIMKLDGLDVHEIDKIKPEDITFPNIIFSNNPKYLNIEDIPFEDMQDEEE